MKTLLLLIFLLITPILAFAEDTFNLNEWEVNNQNFEINCASHKPVVPIPPSIILLASGLVGMAGLAWKKKHKK